jgi:hypothetical protein
LMNFSWDYPDCDTSQLGASQLSVHGCTPPGR